MKCNMSYYIKKQDNIVSTMSEQYDLRDCKHEAAAFLY